MADNLNLWNAVMEDGEFVMYQATIRLYEGGRQRPDVYCRTNPILRNIYYKSFNTSQRLVVESYPYPNDYDIKSAARDFDISLHWMILKNLCGLDKDDALYQNLKEVVHKRNSNAHSSEFQRISLYDNHLTKELDDLLHLYIEILNDLELYTGEYLTAVKQEVRNRIQKKSKLMIEEHPPAYNSTTTSTRHNTDTYTTSTAEKVAIGAAIGTAVGVGVLGLASLLSGSSSTDKKSNRKDNKENQTSKSNEECAIM